MHFMLHTLILTQVPALCSGKYAGLRGPQKYQQSLPSLGQHSRSGHAGHGCAETLSAYVQEWEKYDSPNQVDTLCLRHQECILSAMHENHKSSMASASIVLGLSPFILSTLGPTISEIALLSLNRPLLSSLLTFGTVGVYPSRILSYDEDSPLDIVRKPSQMSKWATPPRLGTDRWVGSFMVFAQYVAVCVAIFNVCYTSWQLGVATVLNWICQSSYMPVVWTVFPFFVHLPAVLALRANTLSRSLCSALASEFKLSAVHKPMDIVSLNPSPKLMFWRGLPTIFSLIHLTLGIIMLSSFLFAGPGEATLILLRYFASALICRLIIVFEISGLRFAREQLHLAESRESGE